MEAFNNGLKPSYIFSGPFRFVKTHEHLFHTYAKGRWVGRPVIDVLEKEFHAYNREYYLDAISKGRILLNGSQFDVLKHFKNNDLLEHRASRTEPPTLNILPKVLFEDETMVVVSKPPYLSIHANGGFHFNSLVGLLLFEMGYNNLHVLHRIDKLTSGVMMFGKSGDVSKKFHESTDTQKCYLARVHGEFKEDYLEYSKPIVCLSIKECTYDVITEELTEEEIKKKNAKESKTIFKKRWYDKETNTSLIECQPITGRTHQIRVHLKSLGHPILNDTLYGGKFVGNGLLRFKFPHLFEKNDTDDKKPEESHEESTKNELKELNTAKEKDDDLANHDKNDKDLDQIVKKLKSNEGEPVIIQQQKDIETTETCSGKEDIDKHESKPEEDEEEIQISEDTKSSLFKLTKKGTVYTLSGGFIENHQWCYITQPMEICLHSVKYKFMSYTFEDEEPYWADKNYNFDKMAPPIKGKKSL